MYSGQEHYIIFVEQILRILIFTIRLKFLIKFVYFIFFIPSLAYILKKFEQFFHVQQYMATILLFRKFKCNYCYTVCPCSIYNLQLVHVIWTLMLLGRGIYAIKGYVVTYHSPITLKYTRETTKSDMKLNLEY